MSARLSKLPRPDPHWTFSANDLADTSPLAIIEWDAHFRVSVWSKRATELFGWSEEEVRGKHLRELSFVHKDDEARVWDVMDRFYAGEMPWVSLQFRTTRKDSFVAHCVWYCTAIRDPSGKLACILTQVLDVTGREQALAQLEESERRFKATFEQAAVGIAHVSVSGHVIRANSRLGEIWGYTTQEVVEHGFADLTHPEDMGPDLDLAMQVLEGVIPRYSLEKRFKHKQGFLIWCALTVSLVRRPDGMPDYFIAVIEDWRASSRLAPRPRRWCGAAPPSWRRPAARWCRPSAWPPPASWPRAWAMRSTTRCPMCWPIRRSPSRSWRG
jgi:PAS domain S-box-containing protein